MASAKFTKEQINVAAKTIESYAKEMQEVLKEEDIFESLDRVDNLSQGISRELEMIDFRLKDCDEY